MSGLQSLQLIILLINIMIKITTHYMNFMSFIWHTGPSTFCIIVTTYNCCTQYFLWTLQPTTVFSFLFFFWMPAAINSWESTALESQYSEILKYRRFSRTQPLYIMIRNGFRSFFFCPHFLWGRDSRSINSLYDSLNIYYYFTNYIYSDS